MTTSQKLTIKASEIRTKLNELSTSETLTDDQRTEIETLGTEYRDVEAKLRAAIIAEDEAVTEAETRGGGNGDGEDAEIRSLQDRVSLGTYLRGYVHGVQLSGAERELAEARNLSTAGNVIPWDVLVLQEATAETRADAVTPSPATGNPVGQAEIVQRVFARSATGMLGVQMPSVPVGTASFPIIGTGQSAQFVSAGTAKDAAAGQILPHLLTPVRLQARVQFRLEDTMTTRGLESALREDLSGAMADQLDAQLLGAGDAQVRGFLATSAQGGLTAYADPSATATFASVAQQAARGVDGVFSGTVAECSWVVGVESYEVLSGLFATNDSTSATDRLEMKMRGFMASAHIPAAVSDIQQGILAKHGAMDGNRNAVCPVWEGVMMERDPITNATTGAVQITATAFYNFRALRPAGFVRTKFKLA